MAWLMLLGLCGYLTQFVRRGWVPHDEGMIGQSAHFVMEGALPHVGYQEAYTGGLTFLYAGLFTAFGVDLVHVRWLLFVGAVGASILIYLLARRFAGPIGAALTAVLAISWSFPVYFAGLPSWWLLICALGATLALFKHAETGSLYAVGAAGLCVGIAIIIKQTGVYLAAAVLVYLLFDPVAPASNHRRLPPAIAIIGTIGALMVVLLPLADRFDAPTVLHLLGPVASCGTLLIAESLRSRTGIAGSHEAWRSEILVFAAAAALPFACLLLPYAATGALLPAIEGMFWLPQKRLNSAAMVFPPALLIVAGVPTVVVLWPFRNWLRSTLERLPAATLVVSGALVAVAGLYSLAAYWFIWQSSRAVGAFAVPIACWMIWRQRQWSPVIRRRVFALCVMTAWSSLIQFPFGAPVYFCYTVPLLVLTCLSVVVHGECRSHRALAGWMVCLLIFATLSLHRGYIYWLGLAHRPIQLETPLNLSRAQLRVSREDALVYEQVTRLVQERLNGGTLRASPDAPEIYFLAGRLAPDGVLFDFFGDGAPASASDVDRWSRASVVVINHEPYFSPSLSPELLATIRDRFPSGESVEQFEVRWR